MRKVILLLCGEGARGMGAMLGILGYEG